MENLDKKAFLAFALSMLLFLGFYWWYNPKIEAERGRRVERARQQQIADSLAAAKQQAAVEPDSGRFEPATIDTVAHILPQATPMSSGTITITSSLYNITLSTAGAEIVSAELLQYKTGGMPVELLPQDRDPHTPGAVNVTLLGTGQEVPLSTVLFQPYIKGSLEPLPSGTNLTLNGSNRTVELLFEARGSDGGRIVRSYTFAESSYVVKSGLLVRSASASSLRSVVWGMGSGLRSTEEDTADDYMNFQASTQLGEEIHKRKPKDFSKKSSEEFQGTARWVSLQTKYFIAALIPGETIGARVAIAGRKSDHFITAELELPAGEKRGVVEQSIDLYMGPLDLNRLRAIDVGLGQNVSMGYKMIRPVSRLILWSMIKLHKVIPNYGVIIIILSVLTKVLFYRLTHKSFKSMRDMQQLQPKLQAIKEKYKDDRARVSQETMKLYKEAGVNPLGGCLPMLLQMPVFIALFSVLKYTIEVRQAPFMLWINDLSQQDVLFQLPFSLPVVGSAFSVLPLLMGAGMLLQTKIGGSVTGTPAAGGQPKMFTYLMPIVFTFIFYRMPSGLVLYWFVNNILSIGQQYYINKEVREDKKEHKEQKSSTSQLQKKRTKKDR